MDMNEITEKLKTSKIFLISCGLCKMDCKNCETEKLIREHNKNVEILIGQSNKEF